MQMDLSFGANHMAGELCTPQFLANLRALTETHHSVYPLIPPQGIFFESLVERAFRLSGWPRDQVVLTTPNSPQHDLLVGSARLSLKTETGIGTHPAFINITKLSTTEREPWDSPTLIRRVLEHLSRYDHIFMLRAIWQARTLIHYQFVEIPLGLLRSISDVTAIAVGKRSGRRSLGVDVYDGEEKVFHIHFDGSDGKCQIRGLLVRRCRMWLEWDQPIEP